MEKKDFGDKNLEAFYEVVENKVREGHSFGYHGKKLIEFMRLNGFVIHYEEEFLYTYDKKINR